MKKGKLIVIDGTDGSGKATQTKLLVKRLAGSEKPIETMDFPRYGTNVLGGLIRECLDGKHGDFLSIDPRIASVLYAGDRFESAPIIRNWLESGTHVALDRYVSANQIHQGGKIPDEAERERFLRWLDRLEHGVFDLPRPDAILYLHVPVEVSVELARIRAKEKGQSPDKAESDIRHQIEAQKSALSIVNRLNNWTKIDCAPEGKLLPPEAIHELIWKRVEPLVS